MRERDKLLINIMELLSKSATSLFDLKFQLELRPETIGQALHELQDAGYVVEDRSSTVTPLYRPASETSLSDLRAKLLPHYDPVREMHEWEQGEGSIARRVKPLGSADLDIESS